MKFLHMEKNILMYELYKIYSKQLLITINDNKSTVLQKYWIIRPKKIIH